MSLFAGLLNIIWVLTFCFPSFAQTCATGKLDPRVSAALKGGLPNLKAGITAPLPEQVEKDKVTFSKLFPQSDIKTIKITADSISLQIYNPAHKSGLPIVISYHEGGFIMPILPFIQLTLWQEAKNFGAIVIAVDYRLPPEHPFPSAVDDAYQTFKWVLQHGDELGGDTSKIIVLGASAGGNLAAVVCQKAKKDGLVKKIKLQILHYPQLDNPENHVKYPSHQKYASGYFLTKEFLLYSAETYASKKNYNNPDFAPILTEDLTGLPTTVIITAEFDPLRDEGEAYADLLQKAGVKVSYKCFPGQIHGLLGLPADAPEKKEQDNFTLAAMSQLK